MNLNKRKNIEIETEYLSENIQCLLNEDKFQRVIDNLVINAIKFTHKDGKIYIKIENINGVAHISIQDTGDDLIDKLFKQYSKAGRKGTSGEESTGLGLYIVKTILDKHNATIEVTSEIGKGSLFLIKINSLIDSEITKCKT